MAKINIEFDTVEKTMVCTKDGETVANVVGAYLGCMYDDPDEYCCEVTTMVKDDANDMRVMTRLVASANGEELVEGETNSKSDVASDIEKYFSKQ